MLQRLHPLPLLLIGCNMAAGGTVAYSNTSASTPSHARQSCPGTLTWSTNHAPRKPPNITNPNLLWLGFTGQPDPAGCSFDPAAQSGFANLGASDDLRTLAAGASLGMAGLYRLQRHLTQRNWFPNGSYAGLNLTADYRERWAALSASLRPWVANGTVRGFHLGDELCWNGLPYEQLASLAEMVGGTEWGAAAPPMIVYTNEAMGPIVCDVDYFGRRVGYAKVPDAVTWVSFDFYNPPASHVRWLYELHLYPKMAPHQRALLVPDASASAHRDPPPGWTVADMVARAWEYFEWAASDSSGRVVGLNPWHWTTVEYREGGYWELGIESVPELKQAWMQIGQAILANRQSEP